VLARDRATTEARPWAGDVEICIGDLLDLSSLKEAMDGVDAAYYLVHSMGSGDGYADSDRQAATNFVRAGRGLSRVVYLGGLAHDEPTTSQHLRSRAEVGRILRDGLPTLELRAGPIIGSGSASFEMVRYLTERLPVIVGPSWVRHEVQPIAIRDTLSYLIHALDLDAAGVLEIGGPRLSFRRMIEVYAQVRGLKRRILSLKPILPARYVAYSVELVTGIPRSLAAALLEGIIHPVLADTTRARHLFPEIAPLSYRDAVELALTRMRKRMVETTWRESFDHGPTYRMTDREGSNRETRSVWIPASPRRVFQQFDRLDGDHRWLTESWSWRAWGPIDRLVGGPGFRHRRRNATSLAKGDELGLWSVEAFEKPRFLRLRADMKMPGKAWLQFEAIPEDGGTRLIQRLLFEPVGLTGIATWYALDPVRRLLFGRLVQSLAKEFGANG